MAQQTLEVPLVAVILCFLIALPVMGFVISLVWKNRGRTTLPPVERGGIFPTADNAHQLGQWYTVEKYTICVHDVFQERVQHEAIVYANVEYRNNTQENLSCRSSQWSIFDVEGYAYDPLSQSIYFGDKDRPRLNERIIAPGMKLRGWLAFKKSAKNDLAHLQFLPGYLSKQTAEFSLGQQLP